MFFVLFWLQLLVTCGSALPNLSCRKSPGAGHTTFVEGVQFTVFCKNSALCISVDA